MKKILIKQLPYGNWAHAYMCALDTALHSFLYEKRLLRSIDFFTDIFIFGGNVFLSFCADANTTRLLDNFISSWKIEEKSLIRAAKQVGVRLEHAVTLDNDLRTVIDKMNDTPWEKHQDFGIQTGMDDDSQSLTSPGIKYSRRTPKAYRTIGIKLIIKGLPLELRGLAVIVLSFFITAMARELTDGFETMIFSGIEWAAQHELVGAVVVFRDRAKAINIDKMYDHIWCVDDSIEETDFCKKVAREIRNNSHDISTIMDENDLAWRSGVIMGKKGWEEVATEENIQKVLDALTVDVVTPSA